MSETLPVEHIRADFKRALDRGPVVVEAPTGSGKSTRIPLWCAEQGRTLVIEPRRLACRALAQHLAALLDRPLGSEVGYAVRFDNAYGPASRVVFVTPGVALRWFAEDGLAGFSSVMLDEFHERRWDTDLLLALLRRSGRHRLVLTSATLEGPRLAGYLSASHLRAEGRLHPVEVRYTEELELPRLAELAERVASAVRKALAETETGDILVFLPGRGEIESAARGLGTPEGVDVVTLHGSISAAGQDRALRGGARRRIILATNVAETSLTIPGVRTVIDSGLERRTHHRNGRSVLGLHVISQAAAEQRRGRAGRLGPGTCIRLWGRQARLEPVTPPEVLREELDNLLLSAAAAGVPVSGLTFIDALPEHALERAQRRLRGMGAVDAGGRLTDHGRRLFPLPLEPLFAHLITAMRDQASREAMIDLAAALSAGRRLYAAHGQDALEALAAWSPEPCDATTLIRLVRGDPPEPVRVDQRALAEARSIADQARHALGLGPRARAESIPREALLRTALEAAPELAFVRRPKRSRALGNGERELEVGRDSRFPEEAPAAVVFDDHSVLGRGTLRTLDFGTCMAPVPPRLLAEVGLGSREDGQPELEEGAVVVERQRIYAGRVIAAERVIPEGEALRRAVTKLVLAGRILENAGERAQRDVEAWNLYVKLGLGEGEPADTESWLESRLEVLGVESGEDLALIEAEDLRFDGIPAWERDRFEEKYPRRVELSNLSMRVDYDPKRKTVLLERLEGKRKEPPRMQELPAWSGWSVRYRNASRVVPIK